MSGATFGVGSGLINPGDERPLTVREAADILTRKADKADLLNLQQQVNELKEIVLRLLQEQGS